MTQPSHDRWVEVTRSPFAHEAAGLELVRKVLPDETPFRAWSNLTFMDLKGRWHEIDLLVLGRNRLRAFLGTPGNAESDIMTSCVKAMQDGRQWAAAGCT